MGSLEKDASEIYDNTLEAVESMGLEEEVVLVYDTDKIASFGVTELPAIVIDNKVMAQGKDLTTEEIVRLIEKA